MTLIMTIPTSTILYHIIQTCSIFRTYITCHMCHYITIIAHTDIHASEQHIIGRRCTNPPLQHSRLHQVLVNKTLSPTCTHRSTLVLVIRKQTFMSHDVKCLAGRCQFDTFSVLLPMRNEMHKLVVWHSSSGHLLTHTQFRHLDPELLQPRVRAFGLFPRHRTSETNASQSVTSLCHLNKTAQILNNQHVNSPHSPSFHFSIYL